jgi:hypothetical protein
MTPLQNRGHRVLKFTSTLYSHIDERLDSPTNDKVVYYIDDNIINFYCITGLKIASPIVNNIGLMLDLNFHFEPIPFNSVSVEKKTFESNNSIVHEDRKNRLIYTYFNPSYNLQLSIFYDLKNENRKIRFALGCGLGNYNSYNSYYRTKIDDIRLKDYLKLKPNDLTFSTFIRISVF